MPVLTERRGRVLLIRLHSQAKLNAMDHAMTLDRPDPGMERVAKSKGNPHTLGNVLNRVRV